MMWWYEFVFIVSYAYHKFLTVTLLLRRVVKNAVWEDLWLSATPGCEVRCPRKKLWHFKNGPENRCLALHTVCHWPFAIAPSVPFESDAFSQCVSSYDLQRSNCTDRRFTSITLLRYKLPQDVYFHAYIVTECKYQGSYCHRVYISVTSPWRAWNVTVSCKLHMSLPTNRLETKKMQSHYSL